MKLLLREKHAVLSFPVDGFTQDREYVHTALWDSGDYKLRLVYDIVHRALVYRGRVYAWRKGEMGWVEVWAEAWHDAEEHQLHLDRGASAPNMDPPEYLVDRIEKRLLERAVLVID
jgi:hypothetical protein